jgi:hypothetical protein
MKRSLFIPVTLITAATLMAAIVYVSPSLVSAAKRCQEEETAYNSAKAQFIGNFNGKELDLLELAYQGGRLGDARTAETVASLSLRVEVDKATPNPATVATLKANLAAASAALQSVESDVETARGAYSSSSGDTTAAYNAMEAAQAAWDTCLRNP